MRIEDIKQAAKGRWDWVVASLAPTLLEAINKPAQHCPCPVHGGTDGFRLFKDFQTTGGGICNSCGPQADGIALIAWATDQSVGQTCKAVRELLDGKDVPMRTPTKPVKPSTGTEKRERLNAAWKAAKATPATKVDAVMAGYLKYRGLPDYLTRPLKKVARVDGALPYFKRGLKHGVYPALVCRVQDANGDSITLHRTYLESAPQGGYRKAAVDDPKKVMPVKENCKFSGSAIRLGGKPRETLHIAEGLETALAVMAMDNSAPCWAVMNTHNMRMFTPPKQVKRLVVWADKDRLNPNTGIKAGEAAAKALADRLDIPVKIKLPHAPIPAHKKGIDWLDAYTATKALNQQATVVE